MPMPITTTTSEARPPEWLSGSMPAHLASPIKTSLGHFSLRPAIRALPAAVAMASTTATPSSRGRYAETVPFRHHGGAVLLTTARMDADLGIQYGLQPNVDLHVKLPFLTASVDEKFAGLRIRFADPETEIGAMPGWWPRKMPSICRGRAGAAALQPHPGGRPFGGRWPPLCP